jgi:hypothetical protein
MTVPWVPPRRTHHLRVFVVGLGLVVTGLAALLFAVQMEAVAPATGVVTARDLQEVRSLVAGLAEPGWYEGELDLSQFGHVRVRLSGQGEIATDPAEARPVAQLHRWTESDRQTFLKNMRFHRVRPGDQVWPGQVLAMIRSEDLRLRVLQLRDRLKEQESRGEDQSGTARDLDRLNDRLAQGVLYVPDCAERWLVLEVRAAWQQAVEPGDPIATLVPIDTKTGQPCDLEVRLDFEEKHLSEVRPGQAVRLYSNVYNHRLHGTAEARIGHVEPWGEPTPGSERRFHATATLTRAPFALPLGSTVKAEALVGRKPVYRIILER